MTMLPAITLGQRAADRRLNDLVQGRTGFGLPNPIWEPFLEAMNGLKASAGPSFGSSMSSLGEDPAWWLDGAEERPAGPVGVDQVPESAQRGTQQRQRLMSVLRGLGK